MSEGSDACIMTLFLNYSKNGDEEFMEGTYTSMNTRDSSSCGRGTVFLRKVTTSDFYKEPFLVKREQEALKKKITVPPVTTNSDTKTSTTKSTTTTKTSSTVAKKTTPKKNTNSSAVKKALPPNNSEKDIAKANPSKSIIAPPRTDTVKQIDRKLSTNIPTPRVLSNRQNELVKTITVNTTEC
jgi:hypothetical protein